MATKTKFTWADLKRIANEIPDERLNDDVTVWHDESGCTIGSVLILAEDYVWTDEGVEPKSVFLDNTTEEWDELENPITHRQGERILCSTY